MSSVFCRQFRTLSRLARHRHGVPQRKVSNSSSATTSRENEFFARVLQRFPPSTADGLCFAYGSAVFGQAGNLSKDNVTDFILTVDNPVSWHARNLELNPSDYSGLMRRLGPKLVADVQERIGARLFFNTLVPFESGLIKYGVISRAAMLADLLDWESLYAAGRLHKPVRFVGRADGSSYVGDPEMNAAVRLNLQSALHTALILLPESFTEEQFYMTLAGLSYTGDFRMVIGEDRNKVANIVRPNLGAFRELYARRLASLNNYVEVVPESGRGDQDTGSVARHFHLNQLPKTLQWNLVKEWNRDGRYRDVEDVLRSAAYDRDSVDLIGRALAKIIAGPSVSQAAKGILSAGAVKTVKYSAAKLRKMYKSLK